jgi:amidase
MHQHEPYRWTAVQAAQALEDKSISAVELAQAVITQIERTNRPINAICAPDYSRAIEVVHKADECLARGERKALLGIPVTIKEMLNVAGLPTTYGYAAHRDFVPDNDALVVARARKAGAVIIGKVNAPTGGADWQTFNEVYGVTNNPFDLTKTCGGSSGGSAAALAMGFGPLSIGSDIAGSLRVPANFCGVFAHKPSVNVVPVRGHTAPRQYPLAGNTDMLVVGPMARSAADLSLLLDTIAGPDDLEDGIGYQLHLRAARHNRLSDFRILVLNAQPLTPTDAEMQEVIDDLAGNLERAGATVVRQSELLPNLDAAARLYVRLLNSASSVFLPDDVFSSVQAVVAKIDPEKKTFYADYLRGITLTHRDWVVVDAHRRGFRARWRRFFGEFDALICPSAPTPAFPHDPKGGIEDRVLEINGEQHPYRNLMVWPSIATAPGLPSTAIPVAMSKSGLPIGVQIIGPYLEDRTVLKLAELIEREHGGFHAPAII